MKGKIFGRHLSRGGGARKALFRSLISALVLNGKIKTTKAKAKAVRGEIDSLIAWGKKDTIASKRRLSAFFGGERKITYEITQKIVPALKNFRSGFTKIIPLPPRAGDGAPMVRMQWVVEIVKETPKVEKDPEKVKEAKSQVKKPKVTVKQTKTK